MTRPAITSSSNPRLKAVRRLRRRRDPQLFLAEGHRALRHALEADARVAQLYVARELFVGPGFAGLVAHAEGRGATIVELSAAAFARSRSARGPTGSRRSSSAGRPSSAT